MCREWLSRLPYLLRKFLRSHAPRSLDFTLHVRRFGARHGACLRRNIQRARWCTAGLTGSDGAGVSRGQRRRCSECVTGCVSRFGIARSETSIAATACSNERHLSLASFHLLGQQRSKRGGHSTANCGSHASATGNTSRPARQYRFKPAARMHANARYSTSGAARTRPCYFSFDIGPSVAPSQPLSGLSYPRLSVECSRRTFSCQIDMQCGPMRARRHMLLCRRAQPHPTQPNPPPAVPVPPHPESTGRRRAVVRSTAA